MHPRHHIKSFATKPAALMAGSGEQLSYEALETNANKAAHLFRSLGCNPGDVVAFVLENTLDLFSFVWGAQRAGLFYLAISRHLTVGEIEYIAADSNTKLLLSSDCLKKEELIDLGRAIDGVQLFTLGDAFDAWQSWQSAIAAQPSTPIADESRGADMLYSSGTTGRPKGVVPKVNPGEPLDATDTVAVLAEKGFGFSADTIYLSPAPLYHAAPLRWCITTMRLGGTVVVMEKFDAESVLQLIEKHQISIAQFVPTHFVRLLNLPAETHSRYDLGSLKMAMHAAAPCPPAVKRAMLDWWGPLLVEYYGGSEGNGLTMINSQQWLSHPGSVGKAILGIPHSCDDDGNPLEPGAEGTLYFENGADFSYHNDPEKTAKAYNKLGWSTMGDIGRIDEEGYVYLTDRKSFMIISGGVNIYPQEIENHLQSHPDVLDVAVVGGPDPDMGERLIAFVQLTDTATEKTTEQRSKEFIAFCRQALSSVKVPREFRFVEQLERTETGKLMKRKIRDALWADSDTV